MSRARLGPVVLTLMTIGCAGPLGTIHSDAPPPPVTAFDGIYRGTIRSTSAAVAAQGSWCDTPGQPAITVVNGQFTYTTPHPEVPGNPTPDYEATMASDGSFYGQDISGTISGRVSGTHMEGKIEGEVCGRLQLPREPLLVWSCC
jgi:hypothetical protein